MFPNSFRIKNRFQSLTHLFSQFVFARLDCLENTNPYNCAAEDSKFPNLSPEFQTALPKRYKKNKNRVAWTS